MKYVRLWLMYDDGEYYEEYQQYRRAVLHKVALSALIDLAYRDGRRVIDSGCEMIG